MHLNLLHQSTHFSEIDLTEKRFNTELTEMLTRSSELKDQTRCLMGVERTTDLSGVTGFFTSFQFMVRWFELCLQCYQLVLYHVQSWHPRDSVILVENNRGEAVRSSSLLLV